MYAKCSRWQLIRLPLISMCSAEPLLTERIKGDPRAEWIARGGFSEVYRVLVDDGNDIAMKEIRLVSRLVQRSASQYLSLAPCYTSAPALNIWS